MFFPYGYNSHYAEDFLSIFSFSPQNKKWKLKLKTRHLLSRDLLQAGWFVEVEMAGDPGPDGEDDDGGQYEGDDCGPPHPGLLQIN